MPTRFPWLPLGLLQLCLSCQAPLEHEPWSATRAGKWGLIGRTGIYADYEATSTISFESSGGPVEEDLDTDLEGRFGLGLGGEYFIVDDFSILAGVDLRLFEPQRMPGLIFDDITTWELFLATHYILPWRWLKDDRLRSFVGAKFAVVPETRFDYEFDLAVPGTPNPQLKFSGGPYTTIGASTGLLYQLRDNVVAQLSMVYEWPLSETDDTDDLEIGALSAPIHTTLKPKGLIVMLGLSFYL